MRSALSVVSDEKILLPVTGARNTGNEYFSAYGQVLGYHNPMYSRQDYELALRNLKSIFGGEAVEKFFDTDTYFNKTEMEEYFSGAYLDLPRSRLENLRDNAGLRFYLLDIDRSDLGNAFLCKGDRYYVYDLNVL